MYLVHLAYEWVQARSYQIGGFTVVYPISRGTVPLLIAILSGWLFGEGLSLLQWLGLLVLSGAICGLAVANMRALGLADLAAAAQLRRAIAMALVTGALVTAYTLYDAWGIRMADDPFTVIAWFFVSGLFGVPAIAALRWRRMPPAARPPVAALARRGVLGACIAFVSFGGIMLGTRIGNIAEVAAVRETSIIFATLIGVTVFRERVDARRLGLIGLIAAGAVLIKVV